MKLRITVQNEVTSNCCHTEKRRGMCFWSLVMVINEDYDDGGADAD